MKKVCILTEGGRGAGYGHLARCRALYDAFEERSCFPEFVADVDETAAAVLGPSRVQVFDWRADTARLSALLKGAAVAVVDSYRADAWLYRRIADAVGCPVYLDDTLRLSYPRGIVLNGAVGAERLAYPERPDITYLLGARYVPLRREFWDVEPRRRTVLHELLVTFGGGSAGPLRRVLDHLAATLPDVRKRVLLPGGAAYADFLPQGGGSTDVILCRDLDAAGVRDAMAAADAAVSAGGQTLYELARMGVPAVGVAVADNQRNNLEGWSAAGFLRYAGTAGDAALACRVGEALAAFADRETADRAAAAGRAVVDGQGARRAAAAILRATGV